MKYPFSIACIAITAVCSPTGASAQTSTTPQPSQKLILFGLEAGGIIPREPYMSGKFDCAKIPKNSGSFQYNELKPKPGEDFCIETNPLDIGRDTVKSTIRFSDSLPSGFWTVQIVVERGIGRINEIKIDTWLGDIRVTYLTLVEKFGKPERDPIVKMQNGFGAQWEEIHADWTFPDGATLQYRSGKGGREHGSITATAGVVEKEREARRAASRATERGL